MGKGTHLVGADEEAEVQQIVLVREVDLARLGQVQLVDVCGGHVGIYVGDTWGYVGDTWGTQPRPPPGRSIPLPVLPARPYWDRYSVTSRPYWDQFVPHHEGSAGADTALHRAHTGTSM